jgi:hypothetical protein
MSSFVRIGDVTDPTYLDTESGNGSWEYEITFVMRRSSGG